MHILCGVVAFSIALWVTLRLRRNVTPRQRGQHEVQQIHDECTIKIHTQNEILREYLHDLLAENSIPEQQIVELLQRLENIAENVYARNHTSSNDATPRGDTK